SAIEDRASLPFLCIGDDAKCARPIPLPFIRRNITDDEFTQLLRVAFAAHVDRNAAKLRSCPTPGCEQLYIGSAEADACAVTCPACSATVCTGCNAGGHTGMKCVEKRARLEKERARVEEEHANDDLARQLGIKRCPGCHAPIEKYDGCNRVQCPRCSSQFCWVCLKTFPEPGTVYRHMEDAHGG
ncbi:hypothetical protein EXIGLDRAFT_587119, partial [Exidia glandulosa HHB12029]